ncbi:hypothetical protein ASY01nite_08060 [Acetobacter syzygii]|nr:hypothetical protein Absy_009_119 [Acetobacter syzygii]GBR62739.1 hypothetical protein AA0483_0518 [Acetobacter syzygii NRIC 0483]GEL55740.1 hypothetical protein ASY01nite_08060 [Acetobacter syzygii]
MAEPEEPGLRLPDYLQQEQEAQQEQGPHYVRQDAEPELLAGFLAQTSHFHLRPEQQE